MIATSKAVPPPNGIFTALDAAAMSPARYRAWFLAGGGTFLDGFSVVALGIALPLLRRQFDMSALVVGLIGAGLVLGAVFGAWLGGMAADRFGRKPVFLADMGIVALGCFIAATASEPSIIIIGQIIIGIGIGIDFAASGSYVSELMPSAARSRMMVATIALQSVGMVCSALVCIAILRLMPGMLDWRLMLAVSGVLAILFLLGRAGLTESPRWLAGKGRVDEAIAVLKKLGDPPPPGATLSAALGDAHPVQARPVHSRLFSPGFRDRTFLVSIPWMLMDVATYGVGLFTPVILGAIHFGGTAGGPVAADIANAEGTALVDLFLLLGFLAGIVLVPRLGRITMQVAGFAGMVLGMFILLYAVSINEGGPMHVGLVMAGFFLFNLAMNAGPNATTFTMAPSLFPTSMRASASGFAAASAKVGAVFGIIAVPQIQEHWGIPGVLALMAAVSVAGIAVTAALAHAVNREGEIEENEDGALPRRRT